MVCIIYIHMIQFGNLYSLYHELRDGNGTGYYFLNYMRSKCHVGQIHTCYVYMRLKSFKFMFKSQTTISVDVISCHSTL